MPCVTVNIPPPYKPPSKPPSKPSKPPATTPQTKTSAIDYLLPVAAGGLIIGGIVLKKIRKR